MDSTTILYTRVCSSIFDCRIGRPPPDEALLWLLLNWLGSSMSLFNVRCDPQVDLGAVIFHFYEIIAEQIERKFGTAYEYDIDFQ